jgi:hypothetical protein
VKLRPDVIIATVGTAMTVAAKPELSAASDSFIRFLGSAIALSL